ncbi:MAG: hypothetical protein ACR2QC_07595, partial [Gammaproteobacteria bacterium]
MLKVPPFRRKPESPRQRREITRRPPSHPREIKEKETVPFLRRQESPRRKAQTVAEGVQTYIQLPAASRRRRFLPSQEWDGRKAKMAKFPQKIRPEKKSQKKVKNSDFFTPFSDTIKL